MATYSQMLKDTRRARIPVARIAHQLRRANRSGKRRLLTTGLLSLCTLTAVSAVVIAAKPLEPFRETLAANFPLLQPNPTLASREDSGDTVTMQTPVPQNVTVDVSETRSAVGSKPASEDDTSSEKTAEAAKPETSAPETKTASLSNRPATPSVAIQMVPITSETDAASRPEQAPMRSDAPFTIGAAPTRGIFDAPRPGTGIETTRSASIMLLEQTAAMRTAAVDQQTVSSAASSAVALDADVGSSRATPLALKSAALTDQSCAGQIRALARNTTVYFEKGSASVSFKQTQQLRAFGAALEACPEAKIDVGGHADKSGEQQSNMQLSWQRAEAVIKSFKALGFKTGQLSPVGFSAFRPLHAEGSADVLKLNRRVEFLLR